MSDDKPGRVVRSIGPGRIVNASVDSKGDVKWGSDVLLRRVEAECAKRAKVRRLCYLSTIQCRVSASSSAFAKDVLLG
jgi:hypothetical protein